MAVKITGADQRVGIASHTLEELLWVDTADPSSRTVKSLMHDFERAEFLHPATHASSQPRTPKNKWDDTLKIDSKVAYVPVTVQLGRKPEWIRGIDRERWSARPDGMCSLVDLLSAANDAAPFDWADFERDRPYPGREPVFSPLDYPSEPPAPVPPAGPQPVYVPPVSGPFYRWYRLRCALAKLLGHPDPIREMPTRRYFFDEPTVEALEAFDEAYGQWELRDQKHNQFLAAQARHERRQAYWQYYHDDRKEAFDREHPEWRAAKAAFDTARADDLVFIKNLKAAYLDRDPVAFAEVSRLALRRSDWPFGIGPDTFTPQYDSSSSTLTVEFLVPRECTDERIKYEEALMIIALAVAHIPLAADQSGAIAAVQVSGRLAWTDPRNGQKREDTVISLQRGKAIELAIDKVDPRKCFDELKGALASEIIEEYLEDLERRNSLQRWDRRPA